MEFLTTGNFGNNVLSKHAEAKSAILETWEKTGLLNKLSGYKKQNVAQLLENQATYLKEATEGGAGSRFDTIAFPVIRRIYDRLLVNNIATIQTLALPTGKVFYMDIRISFGGDGIDKTLQNNISETDQRVKTHEGKKAPKNTAYNSSGPQFAKTSAYERYYDLMGWDFSKGRLRNYGDSGYIPVSGSPFTYTNISSLAQEITVNRGNVKKDANLYNSNYPFDVSKKESFTSIRFTFEATISGISNPTNVALCYGDPNNPSINDKIVYHGENIRFFSQIQTWGQDIIKTPSPNQILLSVILDWQSMINANPPYNPNLFYLLDTSTNTVIQMGAGDVIRITPYYDVFETLEGESRMGEVTVVFTSQVIDTEIRKLRAHWTPEVAQDVEAYLSIDIETEYTAILSELIGREIDQEVLNDLIKYAAFRAVWDYNGKATEVGFFGTQKDWNQTLITRINEISAQIYKATLMGGANFVVCSPEVGAIFNDLEYFHVDGSAAPENDKFSLGIEKIGTLGNRIVVYQVAYMPPEIVLVGRKGNSFFETGYIYAPFIPLMLTETITDPNDFTRRKGIMTRYGKVLINNRFYGLIYIKNVRRYV